MTDESFAFEKFKHFHFTRITKRYKLRIINTNKMFFYITKTQVTYTYMYLYTYNTYYFIYTYNFAKYFNVIQKCIAKGM